MALACVLHIIAFRVRRFIPLCFVLVATIAGGTKPINPFHPLIEPRRIAYQPQEVEDLPLSLPTDFGTEALRFFSFDLTSNSLWYAAQFSEGFVMTNDSIDLFAAHSLPFTNALRLARIPIWPGNKGVVWELDRDAVNELYQTEMQTNAAPKFFALHSSEDTDHDGFSDAQELLETQTDPTVFDYIRETPAPLRLASEAARIESRSLLPEGFGEGKEIVSSEDGSGSFVVPKSGDYVLTCTADDRLVLTIDGMGGAAAYWDSSIHGAVVYCATNYWEEGIYPYTFSYVDYGNKSGYDFSLSPVLSTNDVPVVTNCVPSISVNPSSFEISKKNPPATLPQPEVVVEDPCSNCAVVISSTVTNPTEEGGWFMKVVYSLGNEGVASPTAECVYSYSDDKDKTDDPLPCCTEGFDPSNACVSVRQKFGRTAHIPNLPAGRLIVEEANPTSRLFTPAALKYDHPIMRKIMWCRGYDALIRDGKGMIVEYRDGKPSNASAGLSSFFYFDGANYVERLSSDLEVIYEGNSVAYVRQTYGEKIKVADLGIRVSYDTKYRTISSIESDADGTISVSRVNGRSWRMIWRNSNREVEKTFTFNCLNEGDVALTETKGVNGPSFTYHWVYDENAKDWVYTKGVGAESRRTAKSMTYDESRQVWEVVDSVTDADGNPITSSTSLVDMSGPARKTVGQSVDGQNLASLDRDENGFTASETNARGATTSYVRDIFGRIIEQRESFADTHERVTTYAYPPSRQHAPELRPSEKVVKLDGITIEHIIYDYSPRSMTRYRVFGYTVRKSFEEYDEKGRLILSVGEDGRARRISYTPLDDGGLIETRDTGIWDDIIFSTVPGKSKRIVRSKDRCGNAVEEVESILIENEWQELSRETRTYDTSHRVTSTIKSNGKTSAASWNCTGPVWRRDEEGIITSNVYNSVKALVKSTRLDPQGAVETSYLMDGAGRVTNEVRRAEGCPTLVRDLAYDGRNRVIREIDFNGVTNTISYSSQDCVTTKTDSLGGTEVTTVSPDGQLLSVTGTATVARFYTYGVTSKGETWVCVHEGAADSPRYETTYRNSFGEVVRIERSGYQGAVLTTEYEYDAKGRLTREATTGMPTKTYQYDDTWGDLVSMTETADGVKRSVEYNRSLERIGSEVYNCESNTTSASGVELTTMCMRTQLSGLSLSNESHRLNFDKYGTQTENTSSFDPLTSTRRIEVASEMVSNRLSQVLVDGNLVESVSESAVTNCFEYNAYGWKIAAIDGRGNRTSYEYDHRGNLIREADAAGGVVSRGYDAMNRLVAVTNEVGNVTRYEYDAQGRKTYEGGATYPVRYAYDSYGNRVSMTTYRNEAEASGDTTTWVYDVGSGLVVRKVYADGNGPSYTYTPEGKLASRTWARGIVTNYAYDGWGNLISTTYSDGTPAITYSYDALGRVTSTSDVSGKTTYTYDEKGDESEIVQTGLVEKTLTRHYDDYGRNTGYSLDGTRQITVGYDSAFGRIASADIGGMTHTWTYLEGSDLKSRLDYGDVGSAEWSYEPNRDLLTQVKNSAHGSVISQYDYTNDAAGRRTSKNNELYGYNERGELISATGNGNYSYTYDDIGNRISSSEPENSFAYAANSLNQYIEISDVNLNLQPTPFTPLYDLDGNQTLIKTKTGIWSVAYNGENRPIDWTCGATNIVMKYDRMGRRVEYLETVTVDSTISTNRHQRFVYDNYLCVERLDASNTNVVTDVFVWDPTEPIATRPLQWQTPSDTYAYFHDGNKNVTDVIACSSVSSSAHNEYEPFGLLILHDGACPSKNPFSFSSEYFDDMLGMLYFNYRYLDCLEGRWVQRDFVDDPYSINGNCFLANSPLDNTDFLGLKLVIMRHWPGITPPGGWGDGGRNIAEVRYKEPSISIIPKNVDYGLLTFQIEITPRVSVVDVYFSDKHNLLGLIAMENQHLFYIQEFDDAIEDFKNEAEGILDCPLEAWKKLNEAQSRMNMRRGKAAEKNNELDAQGGPHGH